MLLRFSELSHRKRKKQILLCQAETRDKAGNWQIKECDYVRETENLCRQGKVKGNRKHINFNTTS